MKEQNELSHDVFISYSRNDLNIAERLSRRIRRYTAPKGAGINNKKLKVFRDIERLTLAENLSEELKRHLFASEWLMLICSPNSKKSDWVNEEVKLFLQTKGMNRIIFVLVEGELNQSLPTCLSNSSISPLYINLIKASPKKFKAESLRIIAALHDTDFMTLWREDEKRRKRIRNQTILASAFSLFILISIYLILSVDAIYWKQIEEPQAYGPNNVIQMLPVHEIAINKKNPSNILYLEKNAFWYSDPPLYTMLPEEIPEEFSLLDSLVRNSIKNKNDALTIARINLSIKVEEGANINCDIKISGIIDDNSNPRYIRSIYFKLSNTKDSIENILIPPTLVMEGESPFDLGRPVEILVTKKILEKPYAINSEVLSLLSKKKYPIEYDFEQDEFFSDGYYSKESIRGEEFWILGTEIDSISHDPLLWNKIKSSDEWLSYHPPFVRTGMHVVDVEEPGDLINEIVSNIKPTNDSANLSKLIADGSAVRDELLKTTLLITESPYNKTYLLKAQGLTINRHDEPSPASLDWVIKFNEKKKWKYIEPPSNQIIGIWPLDTIGAKALLLSSDKGYYITNDEGKTWTPANYNENGFADGNNVKTFVLGSNKIYALIDRGNGINDERNPLFSLEKRTWFERWRTGIIEFLK